MLRQPIRRYTISIRYDFSIFLLHCEKRLAEHENSMNKNELAFEQAKLSMRRFELVVGLLSHVTVIGGIGLCVWLVFEGLRPLVQGQSPEAISALAKVVQALELGSMAGYAWGVIASGAWWLERRGKQRAISAKSRYQRIAEANDPERTSSGLTEVGATPREVKT